MANKLTKIDSMQKKVDRFDVIVASFEAFLKEKCVHVNYFKEWDVSEDGSVQKEGTSSGNLRIASVNQNCN